MNKSILRELYFKLELIRKTQEKIAELYPEKGMKCPCHLCIGEEAIAAGVCTALKPSDKIVSFYRSHGHFLAKGGDPRKLLAELYGKSTGANGGRVGSMLTSDPAKGIMLSSAIVGGGISIATGLALAFKIKKERSVAVGFFGDAATEEGVFHESLNFAALHKLPVIFVCENNSYAVTVPLRTRQPDSRIARFTKPHGIPGVRVNGNDVVAVYEAARKAVERARNGGGPALIEGVTNRLRGHIESFLEKTDNRSEKEIRAAWKKEPLKRFTAYLTKTRKFTPAEFKKIDASIDRTIARAVAFAKESPYPSARAVLDSVYA